MVSVSLSTNVKSNQGLVRGLLGLNSHLSPVSPSPSIPAGPLACQVCFLLGTFTLTIASFWNVLLNIHKIPLEAFTMSSEETFTVPLQNSIPQSPLVPASLSLSSGQGPVSPLLCAWQRGRYVTVLNYGSHQQCDHEEGVPPSHQGLGPDLN